MLSTSLDICEYNFKYYDIDPKCSNDLIDNNYQDELGITFLIIFIFLFYMPKK